MQRTQVRSQVEELRSHKSKKERKKKTCSFESKTTILGNEYYVKSEKEGEVEDEPRMLVVLAKNVTIPFRRN